tara:strand:+ start:163 stop:423 length:261 start_codon:yes stop_codon:yes gene_type:complete
MTPDTVQDYIVDELGMTPRHNIMSLTQAISDIAEEQDLPHEEVMRLLLANEPTSNGMSHSYGFHTRWGRFIINTIQERYYEYEGEI